MNELYIFGASTNGEQCLNICRERGITVLGFLDNFSEKEVFNGRPVLRPEDADRSRRVVVTSPVHCLDITLQLEGMGFNTRNLSQFYSEFGLEPDWTGDMEKHRSECEWVRDRLEDAESVSVFDSVMEFRLALDPRAFASVRRDIALQWFDPEFFKPGPHVYVDGGAYNGDTAEAFIRACPEYKEVYLFEPSARLARDAQDRLSDHRNIHVMHAGLSDRDMACYLQNAGLPGGHVGIDGEKTTLIPLDTYKIPQPTFIKLDVEGCELAALRGAEGHIRAGKPMLALAVYHKPEDIWQIPRLLDGMNLGYKFYLRHYTQFYHETVLYCL